MDLADVDKLAKNNKGVKYLRVHQDLSDGTVDSIGMKAEDYTAIAGAFSTMIKKGIDQ